MAVDLLTPILSTRTRSINFFNGRLLAGEDLTTEQQSNRVAHSLLGQAIGDGVVHGLEVTPSKQSSTATSPVLAVTQGLAINKNGAALLLDGDTEVGLVRPANGSNGTITNVFQDCTPTQAGAYVAGAGVYLLTIGPATAPQGLAEVSGTSTTQAPCNSKYNVQGVQFRLIQLSLTPSELGDVNHLRNQVAYLCFGVADWDLLRDDLFDPVVTEFGPLDALRSKQILTNCEVPLAVIYWTADGDQFVDMWSVRRRLVNPAVSDDWILFVGDRRVAEGQAMFLQFQDQIRDIRDQESDLAAIVASDRFTYLPPVGILPLTGVGGTSGFTYQTFFQGQAYHDPVFVEAVLVQSIVRLALPYGPVNLNNKAGLRIYEIVDGNTVLPYVIFTSVYVPFQGDPRYDVSAWDYSNFV